ncbi:hypothetical protein SAMN05518849_10190 [Sphingobium sp. AP50]|uniref:hypothetical protein n=1 Tax=Sphingobium sp. AP50 TaxID=1884369 RepID=UPI0008B2BF8F|nr:hypothetical protein [Sphingobium sp. AP50]SEI56385.1 hypothetical protein SAMN05518849_10190 [Sphingobium sp. AP50]
MAAANSAWPGIDCWVIASTRELQGTTAKAVHAFAEQLGWGLVALDWSEIAPSFPRLATLCAAYIDIACGWAPVAKLRASLDALAATPGFEAARDKLIIELKGADTGFASARAAGLAEIERIFADAEAARAIAGPSPALLAQAPPIERAGLRAMVSGWWDGSAQAGVLLGIEGTGKTWEALDAARHLAGLTNGPMPIVIGSARAAQAADGEAALISALSRIGEAAGLKVAHPSTFWQRRFCALWNAGPDPYTNPPLVASRARQTDIAIATATDRRSPDAAIAAPISKILGA